MLKTYMGPPALIALLKMHPLILVYYIVVPYFSKECICTKPHIPGVKGYR